jgi:molecular chaperone DnaK
MNWEHYKEQIKIKGELEEDWYIIGIDLGTTNSVASYWNSRTGKPEPIDVSNGFGKIPMPSVVQYRQEEDLEGEWVIGEEALQTFRIYPESTIMSIKRKMGSKYRIRLNNRDYLPEEIAAMILKALIDHIRGLNPKMILAGVVVSVPYDFDDAAKKATIQACQLAGLSDSLIGLIEEPKAGTLAYNFRHDLNKDEKVMVFDFGGGTLDITIFCVAEKNDDAIHLKVISEGGEAYHGGDHIDDLLYLQMIKWMEEKTGQTRETMTVESVAELSQRARETKERLSGVMNYRVPYTFCVPPFVQSLSRDEFEEIIRPFIQKTKALVLQTMKEGYNGPINPDEINRVLLEGGSSQMPWVKRMLGDIFGDTDKIYVSEQPALDISMGATYFAAMKLGLLKHRDLHTFDRQVHFEIPVPHDIGFEIDYNDKKDFYSMIKRGTPYALAKKTMRFTLSGNNDEDMTSIDLKILERIKKEDQLENCKLIGLVRILGLPKRPEGKTRLEVTLSIDEMSGTVKGYVKDLGYSGEYEASDFNRKFSPSRNEMQIIQAN